MYQDLLNKLKEVENKEAVSKKVDGTVNILKELIEYMEVERLRRLEIWDKAEEEIKGRNCGCKK